MKLHQGILDSAILKPNLEKCNMEFLNAPGEHSHILSYLTQQCDKVL